MFRSTEGPPSWRRPLIHHTSPGSGHTPMPRQRLRSLLPRTCACCSFHPGLSPAPRAARTSVHSGAPFFFFFFFPPRPRGHAPLTRPVPALISRVSLPASPLPPGAPSESLIREGWIPARWERLLPGPCDSRYGGRRLHMINLAHPLHASAHSPRERLSAPPSTFNGL